MDEEEFIVKNITSAIVCEPVSKLGKTYCFADYGAKGKNLLFSDESFLVENVRAKIYFDGVIEIYPLDKDKGLAVKFKKDTNEYIITSV
jgi:hypothetical protein